MFIYAFQSANNAVSWVPLAVCLIKKKQWWLGGGCDLPPSSLPPWSSHFWFPEASDLLRSVASGILSSLLPAIPSSPHLIILYFLLVKTQASNQQATNKLINHKRDVILQNKDTKCAQHLSKAKNLIQLKWIYVKNPQERRVWYWGEIWEVDNYWHQKHEIPWFLKPWRLPLSSLLICNTKAVLRVTLKETWGCRTSSVFICPNQN